MSMTFTKLFSSITESTLWCEPDRVRLVWITMLAMADSRGRVWASVPGLANRARVPLEDAEEAIQRFLSPDKYSRTPDHEGRRIEVIDGGWRLLNHEKYRAIRDEESIKESKRKYINSRRQAEREVLQSSTSSTVERSRHNAEAEAEAEEKKENPPSPQGGDKPAKKSTRAAKQPPPVRPDDVSEQTWNDWLALRTSKRAPVTRTVLAGAVAEAVKAGMTTEEFLKCWCRRGSQGLEAAWLRQDERPKAGGLSYAERAHNAACARVHEMTGGLAAAKPIGINQPEVIDADPFRLRPLNRGQLVHKDSDQIRGVMERQVDGS